MKPRFADLVDVDQFSAMMTSFFQATGIPHGLIDIDNTILSAIGWQDICTGFHRACPATLCRCQSSDRYIADHLKEGPFTGYRCANGLMDYATPIIVDGEHLATMFLGQFFHEPPDKDYFLAQAREFGFDTDTYMAALAKVPVIPKPQVEAAMAFLSHLASMLASNGRDRLRQRRSEDDLRHFNHDLSRIVAERTRQLASANRILSKEVTAERQIESALRQERDFSRAVINTLPGVFYLISPDGRLRLWNRNLEDQTGYSNDELGNLLALDLFHGGDRDVIRQAIERVFVEEQAEAEASICTKDGRRIPYYLTGRLVELDGEALLAGLGIDITERQRATEELEEKNAAIARSNAELEQFAYVASHDLREPLRMISSYITLLERRYADKLDDEAREFIGFAKDGALRMDQLVLDLLDFSRVGRSGAPFMPVDSGAAARIAIAHLGVAIAETDSEVVVADDLPVVMADEKELTRLFQNLVSNAVKYRSPDRIAQIRVDCRQEDDVATFAVTDNGIGIAPEYRERIFLIFQRLHTRQQCDGTGIGLSIAKKIVERHGGTIWVEDGDQGGTIFRFTLPLSRA